MKSPSLLRQGIDPVDARALGARSGETLMAVPVMAWIERRIAEALA
jgi:hypothetical protein